MLGYFSGITLSQTSWATSEDIRLQDVGNRSLDFAVNKENDLNVKLTSCVRCGCCWYCKYAVGPQANRCSPACHKSLKSDHKTWFACSIGVPSIKQATRALDCSVSINARECYHSASDGKYLTGLHNTDLFVSASLLSGVLLAITGIKWQ